jgi:competence protein ComEC
VLSPEGRAFTDLLDVNEHSVVLLVRYGAARVVLAGDAGLPTEFRLAGRVGDVDVLKVGHHGSRSATSDEWLAELRPEVAIVSVGRRNRYGHPVAEVLEALQRHGARVLRTDEAGTITFTTDSTRAHSDIRHHD